MILGNIHNFNGTGLVAFIDVLGFSKEIEEKWDNKEDNPLEKILKLKSSLPIRPIDNIEITDDKSKHRKYRCRVQSISDSVIVSFGFNENAMYQDRILGIIAFFDVISIIWRNALEVGFTVRGAADYGSIFWDKDEIIGPAFLNVYKLEQNHAKTSRIILSSIFNKYLAEIFAQKLITFWNEDVLKILRKDNDGYIILNPHTLYADVEDKMHVISLLQELRDKAKLFEKEKYSPILAALSSSDYRLKVEELGHY